MEALLPTLRITMEEEGLGEELPSIFSRMTRSHTSGKLLSLVVSIATKSSVI